MKLYLLTYIFSLLTLNLFAQSNNPDIPKSGIILKPLYQKDGKYYRKVKSI